MMSGIPNTMTSLLKIGITGQLPKRMTKTIREKLSHSLADFGRLNVAFIVIPPIFHFLQLSLRRFDIAILFQLLYPPYSQIPLGGD